jgi:hypothetical protein
VVVNRIPKSVAWVFGVSQLLALAKPFGGICSIEVKETFYQLVNKALCLYFHDAFASHLSPYEFKLAITKGCEAMSMVFGPL